MTAFARSNHEALFRSTSELLGDLACEVREYEVCSRAAHRGQLLDRDRARVDPTVLSGGFIIAYSPLT